MQEREGKNIVVCCDGTGNEIGENISNVLKLYRVTRKTGKVARQVVFYDPGVGTLARPNPWTRLQQNTVMLEMCRELGFEIRSDPAEYDVCNVTLRL